MKGSSKNSCKQRNSVVNLHLALSVPCQRSRFEGLQRAGRSAASQRLVQTPEAAHLSADLRPGRFQPGHVEAGGVSSSARPHLSLLYQRETDPVGINCVLLFCFFGAVPPPCPKAPPRSTCQSKTATCPRAPIAPCMDGGKPKVLPSFTH